MERAFSIALVRRKGCGKISLDPAPVSLFGVRSGQQVFEKLIDRGPCASPGRITDETLESLPELGGGGCVFGQGFDAIGDASATKRIEELLGFAQQCGKRLLQLPR